MTSTELHTQESARELFRAAYENRYTWDAHFPGFEADCTLLLNGETHSSKVSIQPDLSVSVETADPKVQEWLTNQMKDVVTHRKRSDFEQAHGKHRFDYDGETDETGAVPVTVGGDAMGSNYKLRDNQVVQVSRVMGRVAFTINHLAKLDTGSGYISTAYNAVFKNPQTGDVVRQSKFEDTYEPIVGYYVMTKQVVHTREGDNSTLTELALNNIRPL